MYGIESLSRHSQADACVDVDAVGGTGQGPDAGLLEAVLDSGAGRFAVDAAVADKAEQRLLLAGILYVGNSHPFSNFSLRHSLNHRTRVLRFEGIKDVDRDSGLHRRMHGRSI